MESFPTGPQAACTRHRGLRECPRPYGGSLVAREDAQKMITREKGGQNERRGRKGRLPLE